MRPDNKEAIKRAAPEQRRISVHHIGGRNASRSFPVLKKFEKDMINVLYDADTDCLEQVQELNQGLESELYVLPYCLMDSCRSTSININYDPFTSSLYDSNPDYKSYYHFSTDHDYLWAEASQTVEKRPVEGVTIDHIFKSVNAPAPPPDFLSIDTQGSEYEILLGAKETLKSSVLALVIEVEFHPVYQNQKLFGDLLKLLSEEGFYFVKFLSVEEMSLYRAPVGLRAEGFHVVSDALFLRRADNIDNVKDELRRHVMLRKLAFIAVIFNQFEYGLECLRQSKNDPVDYHSIRQEEPAYLRFLRDLMQNIEKVPAIYPPSFLLKYPSFEASKSRFVSSGAAKKQIARGKGPVCAIKGLLRRNPVLYSLLQRIKGVLNSLFSKITCSARSVFTGYTDVEEVLIKYGLKTQANILRKNRIIQTQFLKKS